MGPCMTTLMAMKTLRIARSGLLAARNRGFRRTT
uniref:Uncharacterized protein n=1 Tax=Anguilla anguilla TaxID=7936 RepID=A0A0E9SUF2_ANGAN